MGHRGQRGVVRGRPVSVRRAGHPRFSWRPSVPGSRYLEQNPYSVIGSAGDLTLSVIR
jgi:hypothetical protein